MNSENRKKLIFSPNKFNLKTVLIPVLIVAAVLLLEVTIGFLIHLVSGSFPADLITIFLIILAIAFAISLRLYVFELELTVTEDKIIVKNNKNKKVLYEVSKNEVKTVAGYFRMVIKGVGWNSPVIILEAAGKFKIIIGHNDYTRYFSWGEDDYWTKKFEHHLNLPTPTHLSTGDTFISAAQILIEEPSLSVYNIK